LLLSVFIIAMTYKAKAQKGTLEAGIHTGVAMTRLYETPGIKNSFYFQTVPEIGLQFSYGISNMFALGTEINYVAISSEREGLLPLDAIFPERNFPSGSYAYCKERIDLDYLEMPVTVSGQIGNNVKLFIGVGPFIGFRLGGRRVVTGSSPIYYDSAGLSEVMIIAQPAQVLNDSRNITADTRGINIGGCERLGVSYNIGRNRIWIETRYSFGQTDIWKSNRNHGSLQTDQLVLRASYTIRL